MLAGNIQPGQYAKIGNWHKKVVSVEPGQDSDDLIVTVYDDIYERFTQRYDIKTWQEIDVRNTPVQH